MNQADRARAMRQRRPPPLASWLLPFAFAGMAIARLAQVRTLAQTFGVGFEEIWNLVKLSESERLARPFQGYEVSIIEHIISAGVLVCFSGLLTLILFFWRLNARAQEKVWRYVEALESHRCSTRGRLDSQSSVSRNADQP